VLRAGGHIRSQFCQGSLLLTKARLASASALVRHPLSDAVRKVDIAHSGQTVEEAIEQLKVEVKNARRDRETVLLVVHGFGASGVGGAIKAALSTELPRLARQHGFRAYGYVDKERIPRDQNVHTRSLNQGSTLLIFHEAQPAKDSAQDFRTNFRNLRSKVRVRARRAP
jgi:hypothetical protein